MVKRSGAYSRSHPTGQAPAGLDASRFDRGEWDAADVTLVIEGLFSEATNNACTCGISPEDHCHYCGAWALAMRDTQKLLEQVLGEA